MTPIAPASKTRRNTPAAGRLMGILPCRGMRAAKIMRNLEVEDQGSHGTRLARQRVPQIRLAGGYPRARAVLRRDQGAGYPLPTEYRAVKKLPRVPATESHVRMNKGNLPTPQHILTPSGPRAPGPEHLGVYLR